MPSPDALKSDVTAASRPVPWQRLRARLEGQGLLRGVVEDVAPRDLQIDRLTDDSRVVEARDAPDRPATCFVAVRGVEADGHQFIDKAIQHGARVVVCEALPDDARARFPGVVFARVTDSRSAVAELACAFYGDPARTLTMIGVTGTNGKTTTTWILHHLLTDLGLKAGLVGTIETRVGTTDVAASPLTTPEPLFLNALLRRMVDAGCTACAMEVSSHALDQRRTRGIPFDVGIFTNLTSDHLNYHGTVANYRAAKKRLFDGLPPGATAVYNADDPSAEEMIRDTAATPVAYGTRDFVDRQPGGLRVDVLASRLDGLRLVLDGHPRTFRFVGRFNAYNLAAAYGAGRALGYGGERVADALAEAPPVPGRFEVLRFADDTTVVVDYAHTADALSHVLAACRAMKPDGAALWCVFGCGGDRDRAKRRVMGSIAEQCADRVVVTSDNPRTEEPEAIMNDIRRGMSRPPDAAWIVDREAAIAHAAAHAAPGDVVVIAGKGHETVQIIGTEARPFDDRAVARRHFELRVEG
jgi:UDP-N-acetylmuramoyl-L-alanyl-D-glutamate--2,6-diaminopimelate ligase